MNILTGLTSHPKQQLAFTLDDGSLVTAALEYRSQQTGWFADLTWGAWRVTGLRLTTSPNILKKWQNLIPFGLAIITQNNVEPLNLPDFAEGTAVLWLLDAADVVTVNETAFAGY